MTDFPSEIRDKIKQLGLSFNLRPLQWNEITNLAPGPWCTIPKFTQQLHLAALRGKLTIKKEGMENIMRLTPDILQKAQSKAQFIDFATEGFERMKVRFVISHLIDRLDESCAANGTELQEVLIEPATEANHYHLVHISLICRQINETWMYFFETQKNTLLLSTKHYFIVFH